MTAAPRRFLLVTLGTLGDLHPYLAIGNELATRGHRVTIATHGIYAERVRAEGHAFAAVPPDLADFGDVTAMMERAMHPVDGGPYIFRTMVLPFVRPAYEAIRAAATALDAQLIVGHPLSLATPVAAEKLGRPWVSVALQPLLMYSAKDPAVFPVLPWLAPIARRVPAVQRGFLGLADRFSRAWAGPVETLRAEEGLSPAAANPMFRGMLSPTCHLALFSPGLAAPQSDWPASTVVCGFALHDRDEDGRSVPAGLEEFLAAGEPPLVFTLGSSAVWVAGSFYAASVAAATRLGRRAVLLVGRETRNALPDPLPPGIAAFDYAPHSALMPRAAAIVHQGGAGTTGQALRAGRPMVVVPFAHDQMDHADRIRRLGVGLAVPRERYDEERATRALARVLDEPSFAARAAALGAAVRDEDGASAAADALERVLARPL